LHVCIFNKSHQGGPLLRFNERIMTGKAIVSDHVQRTWFSEVNKHRRG
jgi:hypothetical protein